jgi:hypothetical protein
MPRLLAIQKKKKKKKKILNQNQQQGMEMRIFATNSLPYVQPYNEAYPLLRCSLLVALVTAVSGTTNN